MTTPPPTYTVYDIRQGIDAVYYLNESFNEHHHYGYLFDHLQIDEYAVEFDEYPSNTYRAVPFMYAFYTTSADHEARIRDGCKMYTCDDGTFRFMTSCPTGKQLEKAVRERLTFVDYSQLIRLDKETLREA